MTNVVIQFDTDDLSLIEGLVIGAHENEGITVSYAGGQATIDPFTVSVADSQPESDRWEHMDETECHDPDNTVAHPFCFTHDRRIFAKGTRR